MGLYIGKTQTIIMSTYQYNLTDIDVDVTPNARVKIADLLSDAKEMAGVRIYVSGGGCSGMNYGMTFAEEKQETDSFMQDEEGFKLVIDPVALAFLRGAQVDYVDDEMNSTFVFNNVFQAVGGSGACGGCGSSQG